jgi:hypothetical protein
MAFLFKALFSALKTQIKGNLLPTMLAIRRARPLDYCLVDVKTSAPALYRTEAHGLAFKQT